MGTDLRGVLTRRSIAVALRARADLAGHDAVSAAHATAPGSRLLSVEEARGRGARRRSPGPTEPEIAYLSEALGRVLAEPVISPTALPPWDNSAMDGYAIRAADVDAATEDAPVRLEVIGEVARRAGARCRGPARDRGPDRDRRADPGRAPTPSSRSS